MAYKNYPGQLHELKDLLEEGDGYRISTEQRPGEQKVELISEFEDQGFKYHQRQHQFEQ